MNQHNIIQGDCLDLIPQIEDQSIDALISDIPYGISLDDWDVLHANTNSALLGQSPAQVGKSGFKRRGKPIRGWSSADRNIPKEYQAWCSQWATAVYPKLKPGASAFIFCARRTMHRAIVALEDAGFLVKDILVWEKTSAHHRAQRLSGVLRNRGLEDEAGKWEGWRLGNLAPIWEPIIWLAKPYQHTLTDNVLEYGLGAIHVEGSETNGKNPTNLLRFGFAENEARYHEAQKPVALMEFLIQLVTQEDNVVLDPFLGSGTTAVACERLNRRCIGFEISSAQIEIANRRLTNMHDAEPPAGTAPLMQGKLEL